MACTVECHYCGRRFPELYRLTPEDIQRENVPDDAYQMSCGECLDKIRQAANLVPQQSYRQTLQNFSWMIPLFSLTLFLLAMLASLARANSLSQLGADSRWLGAASLLLGTLMVWDRTKNRYGFTHNLKWSLNSKRVNVAIAIVFAGIIIVTVSTQLLK